MSHDATSDPTPDPSPSPRAGRRGRRWLSAAVLVAVLLVAAGVAVLALRGGDEPVTTVTDPTAAPAASGGSGDALAPVVLTAPGPRAGRCMVPTPESVARMELALEGTVTDVGGDTVTLEVARWYAGGDAATVELRDRRELAGILSGVPSFEVGQRWLVAGSRGAVAVCGFTQPWSPAGARLYDEAFAP